MIGGSGDDGTRMTTRWRFLLRGDWFFGIIAERSSYNFEEVWSNKGLKAKNLLHMLALKLTDFGASKNLIE